MKQLPTHLFAQCHEISWFFWTASLSDPDEEFCHINNLSESCQEKEPEISCDKHIKLKNIDDVNIEDESSIFFIESSPKDVLTSREACALESAAR